MHVNINTPHVDTHTKRSVSTQKPMLHVTRIWVNLYFLLHIKYSCTHSLLSASVLMCVFTVIRGLPQLVAALRASSYYVYFASYPFDLETLGGSKYYMRPHSLVSATRGIEVLGATASSDCNIGSTGPDLDRSQCTIPMLGYSCFQCRLDACCHFCFFSHTRD